MARTGRPSKLDESTKDQIVAAIEGGLSRRVAAALVGVHYTTIANECKRDRDFLASIKKAEASCELFHVDRVKGGAKSWQSSAWFLERKWWKRWGKHDTIQQKETPQADSVRIRSIVRKQKPVANADA